MMIIWAALIFVELVALLMFLLSVRGAREQDEMEARIISLQAYRTSRIERDVEEAIRHAEES